MYAVAIKHLKRNRKIAVEGFAAIKEHCVYGKVYLENSDTPNNMNNV